MNVYMCVSVHIYTYIHILNVCTHLFFFLIYTHIHFPFLFSFVLKKH